MLGGEIEPGVQTFKLIPGDAAEPLDDQAAHEFVVHCECPSNAVKKASKAHTILNLSEVCFMLLVLLALATLPHLIAHFQGVTNSFSLQDKHEYIWIFRPHLLIMKKRTQNDTEECEII